MVQGPQHHLGAGRRGQAAGVAIVLTQVALRQEAHQREGLDFNHLSCGGVDVERHSLVIGFAPIVQRNLQGHIFGFLLLQTLI